MIVNVLVVSALAIICVIAILSVIIVLSYNAIDSKCDNTYKKFSIFSDEDYEDFR